MRALRQLLDFSRPAKTGLLLLVDAFLCVASVWIAFSLRMGEWDLWSVPILTLVVASLITWLTVFYLRQVYRSVTRFIGSRTILRIVSSCGIMAVILSVFFVIGRDSGVPRTLAVIQPMVFAGLLITSRLFAQFLLFDLVNRNGSRRAISRVLIYGAGAGGRQLAMSIRHEPSMRLCGHIDDDERLAGQRLDNSVVYNSKNIDQLIDQLEIDAVLLALPSISRSSREKIIRKFANHSVRVLTLPAISDFVEGSVTINDLREIQIADLLGRDPVPPNQPLLHRKIEDRTVLVTGAGGSIGSELCRQIGALRPRAIILVEMTEYALYLIDAEIKQLQKDGKIPAETCIVAELGDIAEKRTARRLFERWRPETVFHAAAYKHVPLVEENIVSGLRNNVFGTLICAREAMRAEVDSFILVSTDKAVRPTNVMGASKRVCELVLQALADESKATRFSMVRFGNVLGSSGSVVPRFQQQIKDGGPITLTHRDVTRYFMTIPEAAQLVIQAGAMAEGGEVFVLDMGAPVRIFDMARTMVQLSGLSVRDADNPDGDIEIREIGLRKGEKLYEELLIGENPQTTIHPRIMRAMEEKLSWRALSIILDELKIALDKGDRSKALHILFDLVPEFSSAEHSEESAA